MLLAPTVRRSLWRFLLFALDLDRVHDRLAKLRTVVRRVDDDLIGSQLRVVHNLPHGLDVAMGEIVFHESCQCFINRQLGDLMRDSGRLAPADS